MVRYELLTRPLVVVLDSVILHLFVSRRITIQAIVNWILRSLYYRRPTCLENLKIKPLLFRGHERRVPILSLFLSFLEFIISRETKRVEKNKKRKEKGMGMKMDILLQFFSPRCFPRRGRFNDQHRHLGKRPPQAGQRHSLAQVDLPWSGGTRGKRLGRWRIHFLPPLSHSPRTKLLPPPPPSLSSERQQRGRVSFTWSESAINHRLIRPGLPSLFSLFPFLSNDDQRSVIGKNKWFANLATPSTLYRYIYLKPDEVTISIRYYIIL